MGLHSRPDKRPDPSPTLCSEHNRLAVEVLRGIVHEEAQRRCIRKCVHAGHAAKLVCEVMGVVFVEYVRW